MNTSEAIFSNYAPFWHLWTPENHEVIFSDEETFHAGMNIFAIAAICSPDVKIVIGPVADGRTTVKCTYNGQDKVYLIN